MPTLTLPAPTHTDLANQAAAALGALGISATVHSLPYGSAVDPCTWCDLTDPEAATVQFTANIPDACTSCATTAAHTAIEDADSDTDADLIQADVYAVECPSITSEINPVAGTPGRVTVIDADGRPLAIETCGLETSLLTPDHFGDLVRFDLSTKAGKAAAAALRDALNAAIEAA